VISEVIKGSKYEYTELYSAGRISDRYPGHYTPFNRKFF